MKTKKLASTSTQSLPLTQDYNPMEPKGKPDERKKPKTAKLPKDNFKDKKKEIKTRINALKKIIGQLNQENQAKDSK